MLSLGHYCVMLNCHSQSCLESIHKDEKVQKVFIVKEDSETRELELGQSESVAGNPGGDSSQG